MTPVQVSILVEPGFVPTELALVQDVLRIAGRLGQGIGFDIRLCTTAQTGEVEGIGGMFVRAQALPRRDAALPDHLVVLGGAGIPERFEKIRTRLRGFERMGQDIILLSDAATQWQRLHPEVDKITTHWEDQQVRTIATCGQGGTRPLFTRTGRITTAAGMLSTADVILSLIVAPRSARLAQAVGNVMLMERIRDGQSQQPRSENDVDALRLARIETVILAMEDHIEEPLRLAELAKCAGLSIRQLERKFKSCLGQTPAAFYRGLRLRRAKTLIEKTILPIAEISVACGFGSPSGFAKLYTAEFGITPSRQRAQLSGKEMPCHSHSQPQGSTHAPVPLSARSPRTSAHPAGAYETPVQGAWR